MYKIYVDLDGVLADFDGRIKDLTGSMPDDLPKGEVWKAASAVYDNNDQFFFNMDKMSDADLLWDYVSPYDPIILTATGYSIKSAAKEKRAWVKKYYGNTMVLTVRDGKDKHKFAEKNAILIDDRAKAIEPWIKAGGIGILHTDSLSTIKKLKELGIE